MSRGHRAVKWTIWLSQGPMVLQDRSVTWPSECYKVIWGNRAGGMPTDFHKVYLRAIGVSKIHMGVTGTKRGQGHICVT